MNKKKKLLMQVLKKLLPYWDIAGGILALIEKGYYTEKMIDKILLLINDAIKTSKKKKSKEKLGVAVKAIQKIRDKEEKEKEGEDIESLLETI